MEKYCGNAKPYIYALFHSTDKAAADSVMAALTQKAHSLWYADSFTAAEEKRLSKAAALLVIISPAFAQSEQLKNAVSLATRLDLPVLSVYLEETVLSPGLSMLLGTTQGVMRQNFDSQEAFLEKLCAAPVLAELSVTPGQKQAARRASLGLGLGAAAAVVLALLLILLNPFRETVPIDPDSDLGQLGLSGNALDITQLYIYGSAVRDSYSLTELTDLFVKDEDEVGPINYRLVTKDSGELIKKGTLSSVTDFAQLVNLQELCLAGNQITDLSALSGLTELRMLDLSSNDMAGTALTPLATLPKLEVLNLAYAHINDSPDSYPALQNCQSLKTLYLSYENEWLTERYPLNGVEIRYVDTRVETLEQLQAACADEAVVSICLRGDITIPAGETLTVPRNTRVRMENQNLVNNGSLILEGTLTAYSSTIVNRGTLTMPAAGVLDINGTILENRGALSIEDGSFLRCHWDSQFRQESGALINKGRLSMVDGGEFHFTGGSIENFGLFAIEPDADYHANGGGEFYGDLTAILNSGELWYLGQLQSS